MLAVGASRLCPLCTPGALCISNKVVGALDGECVDPFFTYYRSFKVLQFLGQVVSSFTLTQWTIAARGP